MTTSQKKRATVARMAIKKERRAGQRMKLLLEQMIAELGNARGSQGKIADAIGIDRSTATKLLNGVRQGVSLDTVEGVIKKTGVARDFFLESLPHDHALHYRNYLVKPGAKAADPSPVETDAVSVDRKIVEKALVEKVLNDVRANGLVRAGVWSVLGRFNLEFVNEAMIRVLVAGISEGQALQRALDAAIKAGVESESDRPPSDTRDEE